MRKMLLTALTVALVLVAMPVFAQIQMYGQQGFGAVIQKGEEPMFTGYTSVAQSIHRDSATGIAVGAREGLFYSDPDSIQAELKGGFLQAFVRYSFPIGKASVYFETGGKLQIESQEGADRAGGGLGLSLGAKVHKSIGLQVTGDWLPADGPDRFLLSAAIDLFPDI